MDRKRLAERLSLILQPQAVAVLLYALVSFTFSRGLQALLFFVLGILFVSVFPTLFVLFLAHRGRVSDPDLPKREERFFPYLVIVGMYGVLFILFFFFSAPSPLLAITLCYVVVTFAGAIISLFWKISLHLAGIAGPVTAISLLLHPLWGLLYLLLLPLGWARIYLKKHTPSQAVLGSLLSAFLTYMIVELLCF
jgi:membrane-associated phospholipid phosphatase